jgi:hypothetical protein
MRIHTHTHTHTSGESRPLVSETCVQSFEVRLLWLCGADSTVFLIIPGVPSMRACVCDGGGDGRLSPTPVRVPRKYQFETFNTRL